jgi:uncharacterized delta-60 repeat protein
MIRWSGALCVAVLVCVVPATASAAPGDIDTTFAPPSGVLTPDFGGTDASVQDVIVEHDTGKIVATLTIGSDELGIARFMPDGSLDPTFNPDGTPAGIQRDNLSNITLKNPAALTRAPDGSYVVAGHDSDQIFVARFTPQGEFDTTFDVTGWTFADIPGENAVDRVAGVHVSADGKITVAATNNFGAGTPSGPTVVVARFLSSGLPDESFDENPTVEPKGIVFIEGDGDEEAGNGMIVDPAGRTVVVGSAVDGPTTQIFAARLTATGLRDASFSGDGIHEFGLGAPAGLDQASDVVRQPDGRLVLAAQVDPLITPASFAVTALTDSGQLDTGFGTGGLTVTPVGQAGELGLGGKLAREPGGKIVVVGNRLIPPTPDWVATLVRYGADGTLDTVYGSQGVVQPPGFAAPNPLLNAVDVDADGRAVVGGLIQSTPFKGLLARFEGDPAVVPDTTDPDTVLNKKPKKKSKKKKVKVSFSSTEEGSTFTCKLNKKKAVSCSSPFKAKSKKGKNKLLITATDAAGNADDTPAVAKWKYVPRRP